MASAWRDREDMHRRKVVSFSLRFRRQQKKSSRARTMKPNTPPTTPPTIALLEVLFVGVGAEVASAVLAGVVLASPSRLVLSVVLGDAVAVVEVLGILEDSEVVEELVDILFVEFESSSSGQMPVVQGSLEQHPLKLPTVQTYQSLFPLHELSCRAKMSMFRMKFVVSEGL